MHASTRLDALIAAIRADGGRVDVLPPEDAEHRARQARLEDAFPFVTWGRVDWPRVPDHAILRTEDPDRLAGRVREWLEKVGDADRVAVMWSDGALPMLVIPTAAAAERAEEILMVDWDTWIFDAESDGAARWCIEHYHEGELCLGRAGGG
jgi:hypothetical protein